MNKASLSVVVSACIAGMSWLPADGQASPAELEEATALMKRMHDDQCQQQVLRGRVMLAHRNHDDEALKELWPQIEAISKRLKPSEDRMKALQASIKQNPDEQNAFETALLRSAECG